MDHGTEVATRLGKPERSGIPWLVILDSDGNSLVTSDGPKGNIGYPAEPHEIEHFIAMLHKTAKRLSAEQISEIENVLQEAAVKYRTGAGAGQDSTAELVQVLQNARRTGLEVALNLLEALEKTDAEEFPGIHAFAKDVRDVAEGIDKTKPSQWPAFDVDKLISNNANFWRATYEIAPSDPAFLLLHAGLLLAAGEAQRSMLVLQVGKWAPTFSDELLPALYGGLFFDVAYAPNSVSLLVAGVVGDRGQESCTEAVSVQWMTWSCRSKRGCGCAASSK